MGKSSPGGELQQTRKEIEAELRRSGPPPARTCAQSINQAAADALRDQIDELLLVQRAKDLNVNVDPDVSKYMAGMQVYSKMSDPDKFAEFIRQQFGITIEEFKQKQKNKMMAERVIRSEVGSRVNIPETEIKKYYDEHKADFVRQEEVYLSQILLSTEGKTADQAAAAEKRAKDLVARARQGEKFSDLASTNSDDPATAQNGGYLGSPLKRNELRKEIADIVFTQKKGYVTDPIKLDTPRGLLILKIEDRYEAGQATFEEVKDQIQGILAEPRMTPKIREYLTRLREDAFLEIKDGYLDSGAAPGKDTTWHDVAQVKLQTTTKEEVAARKRKKFLGIIPHGRVGPAPGADTQAAPASPAPAAKAPETPVKK